MNTDTTIAKNIRVTDEKASYDAACKRFLSENTMSVIGCVADNGHKFYVCGSIKR